MNKHSKKVNNFSPADIKRSIILAQRLKQLRNEKGLSHERLVEELDSQFIDVSKNSLMNWEVSDPEKPKFGKNLGMGTQYIAPIAGYYNVSVDWLLGLTDDRHIKPLAADELPLREDNLNALYGIQRKPSELGVWGVLINDMIEFCLDNGVLLNYLRLLESLDIRTDESKADGDTLQRYEKEWMNEEQISKMGYFPLKPNEAAEYFRSQIAFQLQNFLKEKYPAQKEV